MPSARRPKSPSSPSWPRRARFPTSRRCRRIPPELRQPRSPHPWLEGFGSCRRRSACPSSGPRPLPHLLHAAGLQANVDLAPLGPSLLGRQPELLGGRGAGPEASEELQVVEGVVRIPDVFSLHENVILFQMWASNSFVTTRASRRASQHARQTQVLMSWFIASARAARSRLRRPSPWPPSS